MSIQETPETPAKRNSKKAPAPVMLELAFTNAEVSIGTKRSNKAIAEGKPHLQVTAHVDYTKFPPMIASAILREGSLYILRQEANKVEKDVDNQREEAKEKGQHFVEPNLSALVQAAVEARLQELYNGELGRRRGSLSVVERRAFSILRDLIAAHFRNAGTPATNEQIDTLTKARWEANADSLRDKLTKKAEEIIAEETRRANTLDLGLGDLSL